MKPLNSEYLMDLFDVGVDESTKDNMHGKYGYPHYWIIETMGYCIFCSNTVSNDWACDKCEDDNISQAWTDSDPKYYMVVKK